MKIIFNKYGGIKTIEDRQLLVQSSDNANYVDIYYQDDAGNFADETVNLATIAFKRSDTFEISERTCALVKEELTNNPLYFRYIFKEDELAINGELQMTVRLKQVVFDPEDDSKVLLIKQRAMGKITAYIYEAIGGNYENFDVVDGRILQLELWQANFESDYYNADQIDAKLVLERQATNDSLDDHNTSNEAHLDIRQSIENLDNTLQGQIDDINNELQGQDTRLDALEAFKTSHNDNIDSKIIEAIGDHDEDEEAHKELFDKKADLVNGKVPREQVDDYFDDIIEGFYINHQFYSEGEENEDYLITPELGKLYVDVDTNVLHRWIGSQYEKVTDTFELTKAKIEDKLTGDITSHNHATEISNHNTSGTAHTGIRNAVAEAKAIAEGKARAIVFATETALDAWLAIPENVASLLVGDNFYIEETDKPDYWWNGTNKVKLETEKVDLTEYVKTVDLPPQLTLGTLATQAYYGDLGHEAYQHSQATHAPSNAQKNSDITKAEIEAKLTGEITSHSHALPSHNHDDKYYTESEVDTKLGGKASTTHDHTKSQITDFPTSMTPTAHNHTKSEITDFPTIPTIPDLALNDNTETSGKYISKIEVDSANKHKLNITKKDLPQGFSGSYNDLTDKPNVYTKDEADKLFNEIIPIYQVFTNEIGDQLSDIMFDSSYPYRPYYAYNSTSGQLYAYNETNETWGIGFAPSRSRLYYTAKFGTLTVYLYNTTTSKLENIIPTIPTLSHDIATDIADTTKTVTPNAVGNYTYSRSAIDTMIGDIETLLEAL